MDLQTLKAKHPATYAAAFSEGKESATAPAPAVVTPSASANSGGASPKDQTMDLKTLKASHPEVYEAAVQAGIQQERDRVGAHLELGEASGDMTTAIAAVKSGDPMTQTLTAKYLAAGMKRNAVATRQAETNAAGATVDTAAAAPEAAGQDLGDQVVALLEQQGGKKKGA